MSRLVPPNARRGSWLSHLACRMASEGIPERAIQRCLEATDMAGSVHIILERAVHNGLLPVMPAVDWPEDSRVSNRGPVRPSVDAAEVMPLAMDLASYLGFEPAGARLVAALMVYEKLDTGTLRVIVQPKSQDAATLKVHACRARMRLARSDIAASMTTIFGWGYWLQPPERDKVAKTLMARRGLPDGSNVEFGGARPRASSRQGVGRDLARATTADAVREPR